MRRALLALALVSFAVLVGAPAAADDGIRFRRTTPRAALAEVDGALLLGVPSGRAWGVESELRALGEDAHVVVRIEVRDGDVREAFVRVAYYARASGRSRQLAVTDSATVGAGERRLVLVPLDPPPGAVAYRVRVLARLREGVARSRADAIQARVAAVGGEARSGSLLSRLLP